MEPHGSGVAINEPSESWLRLFVSWVADEQPVYPTLTMTKYSGNANL